VKTGTIIDRLQQLEVFAGQSKLCCLYW